MHGKNPAQARGVLVVCGHPSAAQRLLMARSFPKQEIALENSQERFLFVCGLFAKPLGARFAKDPELHFPPHSESISSACSSHQKRLYGMPEN